MSVSERVRKALEPLSRLEPADDGFWLVTHCLYPSNGLVRVRVRGQEDEFTVSDEGAAVDEVTSCGLAFPDADRRIRHIAKRQGLRVKNGVIYSPPVPLDGLPAALMLVANASKEAAHWGLDHLAVGLTRNFREELARLIDALADVDVAHDVRLVGASNKQYQFEHVLRLPGERMVVIDPVTHDASSINAKVVAHLDLKMAEKRHVAQRLVYDDHTRWEASNLNLLRMAATPVPFSHLPDVLPRLVA